MGRFSLVSVSPYESTLVWSSWFCHNRTGMSVYSLELFIWVFMNTKSLRSPANLLVVNLALSDFLMMFTMFPPMVYNCMSGTWAFSGFFCEIYGFLGNLFGCASIWTMIFITADRYNVIVKGVSAKPLSSSGSMLRILGVWTASIVWTILPF
ncbi:UNVERIFIED_CONTAM: hypothetical protein GTU68_060184, partial [Idotea baltica]|nr:hypothetical protein [Idotea baltica]